MGMDSYSFFENVSDLNPLTLVFYILFQFFSNLQLAHFQEYTHIQNVSIFISLYIYYLSFCRQKTSHQISSSWAAGLKAGGSAAAATLAACLAAAARSPAAALRIAVFYVVIVVLPRLHSACFRISVEHSFELGFYLMAFARIFSCMGAL